MHVCVRAHVSEVVRMSVCERVCVCVCVRWGGGGGGGVNQS